MRKKRSIIVLAVCLVLLLGSYAILSQRDSGDDSDQPGDRIDISRFDRDEIVKMKLTNDNGDFIFEKIPVDNGDDEDGQASEWVSVKPEGLNIYQLYVEDLARTFSALSPELLVEEEAEDLSAYGLESPAAVAEAELKDGSKVALRLGDKAASGNTYYLIKDGDTNVYTVASYHGNRLLYNESDLRDKNLPQVALLDLEYLYLYQDGQDEIEVVKRDYIEDQVQYGLSLYDLIKPYRVARGIDSAKLTKEMAIVETGIKIGTYIEDGPGDLSKYGLDEPNMHLIVRDSESELELIIGDPVDDEFLYARTGDSDTVFTLSQSDLAFMDIQPMEFIERFVLIINIEHVDSLVAEIIDETYTLAIGRESLTDEEGEEELLETFYLNGEEKPEDPFRKAYQSLIGLMVDMPQENRAEGEPEVRLTFNLNRGTVRQEVIELYPYDRDFYIMVRNGDMDSEFLVGKNRIDSINNHLGRLVESKLDEE
ncbi:MAG TPA: DUF4340 domain-containing protein [Bacillota bacterium]|nr:DUF4340 domain-containing protein [Bacillota bacterium]